MFYHILLFKVKFKFFFLYIVNSISFENYEKFE